jgi:hypothetical protein
MATRGFASLTILYEAADAAWDQGKPTFHRTFGDHDPSGSDIPRTVEQHIRELAAEDDVTFGRIAVTPGQIEEIFRSSSMPRCTSHATEFECAGRQRGR